MLKDDTHNNEATYRSAIKEWFLKCARVRTLAASLNKALHAAAAIFFLSAAAHHGRQHQLRSSSTILK